MEHVLPTEHGTAGGVPYVIRPKGAWQIGPKGFNEAPQPIGTKNVPLISGSPQKPVGLEGKSFNSGENSFENKTSGKPIIEPGPRYLRVPGIPDEPPAESHHTAHRPSLPVLGG